MDAADPGRQARGGRRVPHRLGRAAVILVRRETDPDDLDGLIHARGVLTSRGGKTSHAAVVARGLGRTCVCGAESLDVDVAHRRFTTAGGTVVAEGDVISIGGTAGESSSPTAPR